MPNQQNSNSPNLKDRYEKYRKGIWDAYFNNIAMLDSRLLTLSAGLLGAFPRFHNRPCRTEICECNSLAGNQLESIREREMVG